MDTNGDEQMDIMENTGNYIRDYVTKKKYIVKFSVQKLRFS